jgi:hypothetical protein
VGASITPSGACGKSRDDIAAQRSRTSRVTAMLCSLRRKKARGVERDAFSTGSASSIQHIDGRDHVAVR